jgi:hypothetical protein
MIFINDLHRFHRVGILKTELLAIEDLCIFQSYKVLLTLHHCT